MNKIPANELQQLNEVIEHNQQLIAKLNQGYHHPAAIRQMLSQITNQNIDDSVEVRLPLYSDFGRNIHLGKQVFINAGVTFTDLGGIYLGDQVLIGPGATLISVNHPLQPSQRRGLELAPVYVQRNAWIGANATILPGVTIGENAVVAAGAVVTKDVAANTVVAGVPARVVKTIAHEEE